MTVITSFLKKTIYFLVC